MALSFFKQKDIDEMDINNIPEEFVNYFETLDDMAKLALLEKRPDIAKVLGFDLQSPEEVKLDGDSLAAAIDLEGLLYEQDIQQEDSELEEIVAEEEGDGDAENDEEYLKISRNYYDDSSVLEALKDNMEYLELLTIPEGTDQCSCHRIKLQKKQLRFVGDNKSVYMLVVKICEKCNRAFLEESKVESAHKYLAQKKIRHTIYDLRLSTKYLRNNTESYELSENEKLYVPDTWIEENPICPIHGTKLFEVPCEHTYKDRKISFKGYCCDICNKYMVRRAAVISLQEQCHEIGLPEIPYETLAKKKPAKKPVNIQEEKPHYCVEEGKRTEFTYDNFNSYFRLTEEDIVVVGDSIYCDLENHETEEVAGLIWIQEKRAGRKLYLFLLGYCAQCQKYYMDIDDYKVIYPLGRPEVAIYSNFENDEFQITSGEVFGIEKNHLAKLESDISEEISSIKKKPDYINPYATGYYDDGGRAYAKSLSKRKYGPRLEELQGYIDKPYSYRVDISCGDDTEVYYVGATDVEVSGKLQVISANSEFGHDLINYQTIKVSKGGKEYDIKLSRQFDIEQATLYGYTNLRTDEDLIFKSGITDPFLVRVLNMRKRQHNMTDIFVTIQENQNKIVDTKFEKNLIVQGCAGSGKTMVLLHRLSSLKYKKKEFDFGKNALILTPNEQFSLHIKGLAEGLQIGNVERASVEQYYVDKLIEYDRSFKPDRQLASEQNVSQMFVDYIYSDQFKVDFDKAYDNVISDRNALAEILENLTDAMEQPKRTIDFSQNTRVIQQIQYAVDAMDDLVKQQERSVKNAKAELEKHETRKQFLMGKAPEMRENASNIVSETLPRVNAKIAEFLSEKQTEIQKNQQRMQALTEEREKVQRTIIMIGKRVRLEELDKQIKEATRKMNETKKSYDQAYEILSLSQEGKTDEEIVSWMRQVKSHVSSVREEIGRCDNAKKSLVTFEKEYGNIDALIVEAKNNCTIETLKLYSDEIKQAIEYLYKKISEYSLQNTFKMIFDIAISEFVKDNEIKAPQGKYYRYILYAQLLFAMKYYGEVHGDTKFMCVDEGQDLALNEYRLIYELNGRNMTFNIFGDVNQLIKPGRGISDWSALVELLHAAEFKLNENYRNTNQITRFCNNSFGMNVLQTGVDGAAVREIPRKELEDELSSMNLSTERVAILVPRNVSKKAYLHMEDIQSPRKELIGEKMENGCISLMYVDEVKGIEFDRVFVVANGMTKNEKYIAYTRALSELILVVDETIKFPAPAKKTKERVVNEDGLSIVQETESTSLKALKRIAGSGLKEGVYLRGDFSGDEIMEMFEEFFSSVSRKDTTYKYAFLKSILDCIPKFDECLKISFDELFGRFTEIYWPLVVNYDIQQKVGDASSRSYVEQLLMEEAERIGTSYDTRFDELSNRNQKELIKKVKQKCKTNVVGALFGDTKQIFYSFNKKEEWLQLNPIMFEFIKKHEEELQEMNYYSWTVFSSRVNSELKEEQVRNRAKLQDVKDAINMYRDVLKSTHVNAVPLLILLAPFLGEILKVS